MQKGSIIKINPSFNDESFISCGLYKAFILKVVPYKGYCLQSSRWIDVDNLYLVINNKMTVNIKNKIYFNCAEILSPANGQLVYIFKEHFCEIGDANV
mgnify:CR=1 FL=1|tara:strand:- start:303 stop:596 length:294 start_codon:yes stop_codon:yes gene_type:complete